MTGWTTPTNAHPAAADLSQFIAGLVQSPWPSDPEPSSAFLSQHQISYLAPAEAADDALAHDYAWANVAESRVRAITTYSPDGTLHSVGLFAFPAQTPHASLAQSGYTNLVRLLDADPQLMPLPTEIANTRTWSADNGTSVELQLLDAQDSVTMITIGPPAK